MKQLTKPCCPRDGSPLEWIGNPSSQALGCRSCSGLWITKTQLEGRIDPATMQRLFQGHGGRVTQLRCPMDGEFLREFDVNGVLIDRCNHCGGLWFDAGELRAVIGHRKIQSRNMPYLDDTKEAVGLLDVLPVGDILSGIVEILFSW